MAEPAEDEEGHHTRSKLEEALHMFGESRDDLQKLLQKTKNFLSTTLHNNLSQTFADEILKAINIEEEEKKVNRLYKSVNLSAGDEKTTDERPCLVIVGQSNSGKSLMINELLGGTFVAMSESSCTARITRLTYSESTDIKVYNSFGTEISHHKPTKKYIENKFLKLSQEERENQELVNSRVVAGINSPFLKSGVDVIDSPGLNENPTLDKLTLGTMNSLLPFIIYVINSHDGVNSAVRSDLSQISAMVQGAKIFYVVTKMDVEKETLEASPKTREELERERAESVFQGLKKINMMDQNADMDSCPNFHCISAWEVRKWRRQNDKQRKKIAKGEAVEELERNKWLDKFDALKDGLFDFAQLQFQNLIVTACKSLQNLCRRVSEMFIKETKNIVASNRKREQAIKDIIAIEKEIYTKSQVIAENHRKPVHKALKVFLESNRRKLLNEVASLEYSEAISTDIDRFKEADKSTATKVQQDISEKCVKEIKQYIIRSMENMYTEQVMKDALDKCIKDFTDLRNKVKDYEKDIEHTPAYQALKETLLEGYQVKTNTFEQNSFWARLKRFGRTIEDFFSNPLEIFSSSVPVSDAKWKKKQAKNYLDLINADKLAECLVNSLKEWLDERHADFEQKIRESEDLNKKTMDLTEAERSRIMSCAPSMAVLYMKMMHITTRYEVYGYTVDLSPAGRLGSGSQGEVYRVLNQEGKGIMAAKRVIADEETLKVIATEVYYMSLLDHPNLVKALGVTIEEVTSSSKWRVDIYSELMDTDVITYLANHETTLKERLGIGYQIAQALEYLHENELVHRDVKLANVLLDNSSNTAKLTDFGLIKVSAYCNKTLAGTPIYLAPELVTGKPYGVSADIHSLGIALWYLAEGSGKRHPAYVDIMPSVGAILVAEAMDCRPERDHISVPDSLWNLMKACWDGTPQNRPLTGKVVLELQGIINNLNKD